MSLIKVALSHCCYRTTYNVSV